MKLSKETLSLLKNYSQINPNLLIKPGNKLCTISAGQTLQSECVVQEAFDHEFGIYDLNEFLATLSLFEDPELTFSDNDVVISQGNMSVKYISSDSTILSVPKKDIKFPSAEVEFTMSSADLNTIRKVSATLKAPDVCFVGDGEKLKVVVRDKKNPSGNTFEHVLGETSDVFQFNLREENLKMVQEDYDVSLSSKRISRFSSTTRDLVYYVAIEADSRFGK